MASLFRARRPEEPRSGGKLLRGRRALPPASPYSRPETSPSPAAVDHQLASPSPSPSPRWLLGLISGAGKLISSVLPSYRSSSSSQCSYSSEEGEHSSDEDEEVVHRLNQRGKESELVSNYIDGQLAVVPKSQSKDVIEQLIMQETFTRGECDRLTQLIQSRVIDFPSRKVCGDGRKQPCSRTTGNDISSPGAVLPLNQRSLPERVPYYSSKSNVFSKESSGFEAHNDIWKKAVMEAKQWLEEKKSASKPKYDSECGPCTLNTDMLQYGIESDGGSPVDMAKSYMKSLPPWRSPSLSCAGFSTPLSCGLHYKDGSSYGTPNNSVPSSKVLKRDFLAIGSQDKLDETRRVRLRSADNKPDMSPSTQIQSSSRVSEHSESSSEDARRGKPGNTASVSIISEKVVTSAVQQTPGSSVPSTTLGPDISLDEQQSPQILKEDDNAYIPHDNLASASRLLGNNGNPQSETNVMSAMNTKLAAPSDADVAKLNAVHTSSIITGVEGTHADGSSQLNSISTIAGTDCISDSRLLDGNFHATKEPNESFNGPSVNGLRAEASEKSDHETYSRRLNTIITQNGTRMESSERMPSEPQPIRRGRKAIAKSRRGRKT